MVVGTPWAEKQIFDYVGIKDSLFKVENISNVAWTNMTGDIRLTISTESKTLQIYQSSCRNSKLPLGTKRLWMKCPIT